MFSAWKVAEDSYNLLGAGIAISPIYRVFRKISGNTYLLYILDYSEVPCHSRESGNPEKW